MKVLLATAAVSAAGILASNADPVYSANVVGFVNISIPKFFSLIANPLNGTNNNINTILPLATPDVIPDGTTIQKWNSALQQFGDADTYYGTVGWLDSSFNPSSLVLNPGEGAFINMTDPATLTFVGEVPQGSLSNSVPINFSIMAQLTPQKIGIDATGFPAGDGDTVQFYNSGTQSYTEALTYYLGYGWADKDFILVDPTPEIGAAFFYNRVPANGTATWTRSFNVQ